MSIYATLGRFKIEHEVGFTEQFTTILAQGVPPHIGHPRDYPTGDPYANFLPPVVDAPNGAVLRAVVFVLEDTPKDGREYVKPLLVLSGEEWMTLPFPDVWQRLEDALGEVIAARRCAQCGQEVP